MSSLSIRLPEELKTKALRLAKKKNMSLNSLVSYWLQTAVVQEETMEWMTKRLRGQNSELLIHELGGFLQKTKPGTEPELDEIRQAMNP